MQKQAAGTDEIVERELGEISALDFQRYAVAVGDLNPIYFDEQAAIAAGYEGIVSPPNYVTSVQNWGPGPLESELQADGTQVDNLPVELRGLRLMGGGHDLVFDRPIYPGDRVRTQRRVIDRYEKSSKAGELTFIVYEVLFFNQRNERVITCKETVIAAK